MILCLLLRQLLLPLRRVWGGTLVVICTSASLRHYSTVAIPLRLVS